MPKISIIIPVYKVEEYLPACLDSVLSQTFTDWEAVCVNDGSPDNCGSILAEYFQKDNRIKVITQENQGVSVARNKAMEVAKGEYISFLDPDDELAPTFLEKMYQTIVETNADIVWCDFQQGEVKYPWKERNVDIQNYTNVFERFVEENPKMNTVIWNKLYRRELLSGLDFPETISMGEDLIFSYKAMYRVKKAACIPEKLYFYRKRLGSAVNRALSESFLMGNIQASIIFSHFFRDKELSPKTRKILNQRIAKRMFKFAVLEPKRKDKENLDKWYALTGPLLAELKRQGIYQPKYLTIKNQLQSWWFLKRIKNA